MIGLPSLSLAASIAASFGRRSDCALLGGKRCRGDEKQRQG